MDPEPKRSGVVQLGFENARVFGQDVLPVSGPVVCPAGVGQETRDCILATAVGRPPGKPVDFGQRWYNAGGVEYQPTQERVIVGDRFIGSGGSRGFQPAVDRCERGIGPGKWQRLHQFAGQLVPSPPVFLFERITGAASLVVVDSQLFLEGHHVAIPFGFREPG